MLGDDGCEDALAHASPGTSRRGLARRGWRPGTGDLQQHATRFLPTPEHSDPSGLRLGSNQRLDRGTTSLEGRVKTGIKSESRFENDASRYAAYLETPEGRLRAGLAFANLQEFLPASAGVNSLRALDIGCGTGAAAVRLARLGIHVTLLDSSATMLALAERTIVEAGVSDKITVKRGNAAQLADIFQTGSFDIILCHNLLEYVADLAPCCAAPCV